MGDGSREQLDLNLARFGLTGAAIIEGDAFETLRSGALEGRTVGVYYYDNGHEYEQQLDGMRLIEPYLASPALVIVDDTDWERVERAVDDYLAEQPRATEILSDRRQGPRRPAVVGGHARPPLGLTELDPSAAVRPQQADSAAISRCSREPPERLHLDLAHAFARDSQPPADLLERLRVLVAVEPVAQLDHELLALRQRLDRAMERVVAEREHDFLLDVAGILRDEVAERGVAVVADGLVEARDRARGRAHLLHVLERKLRLVGDLFVRRLRARAAPRAPAPRAPSSARAR